MPDGLVHTAAVSLADTFEGESHGIAVAPAACDTIAGRWGQF